ncbi:MAG: hypothetical protein H0T78_11575, partial [Longispora sp.]|nr:hypothetical protein [Longispora sp. (in: high G+C Gram-positive bacteria)]
EHRAGLPPTDRAREDTDRADARRTQALRIRAEAAGCPLPAPEGLQATRLTAVHQLETGIHTREVHAARRAAQRAAAARAAEATPYHYDHHRTHHPGIDRGGPSPSR